MKKVVFLLLCASLLCGCNRKYVRKAVVITTDNDTMELCGGTIGYDGIDWSATRMTLSNEKK